MLVYSMLFWTELRRLVQCMHHFEAKLFQFSYTRPNRNSEYNTQFLELSHSTVISYSARQKQPSAYQIPPT